MPKKTAYKEKLDYNNAYNRSHYRSFSFRFNKQSESEIIEWLISNFIFYHDKNLNWSTVSDSEINNFFSFLWDNHLLEYAFFCAQKSDTFFSKALYSFTIGNYRTVSAPKLWYAILRFIYHSSLKRLKLTRQLHPDLSSQP